ncbi:unnamed protein product [Phytophthora fragariaefolia]|uniref:Unnamed protein product n=1 Tax=Phytophthora fragariaefolia TaxID=1490495 RepID=A0A9W6WQ75_9STRA|nr:unnamed protein product [Phytophthora fragariaefolia]
MILSFQLNWASPQEFVSTPSSQQNMIATSSNVRKQNAGSYELMNRPICGLVRGNSRDAPEIHTRLEGETVLKEARKLLRIAQSCSAQDCLCETKRI